MLSSDLEQRAFLILENIQSQTITEDSALDLFTQLVPLLSASTKLQFEVGDTLLPILFDYLSKSSPISSHSLEIILILVSNIPYENVDNDPSENVLSSDIYLTPKSWVELQSKHRDIQDNENATQQEKDWYLESSIAASENAMKILEHENWVNILLTLLQRSQEPRQDTSFCEDNSILYQADTLTRGPLDDTFNILKMFLSMTLHECDILQATFSVTHNMKQVIVACIWNPEEQIKKWAIIFLNCLVHLGTDDELRLEVINGIMGVDEDEIFQDYKNHYDQKRINIDGEWAGLDISVGSVFERLTFLEKLMEEVQCSIGRVSSTYTRNAHTPDVRTSVTHDLWIVSKTLDLVLILLTSHEVQLSFNEAGCTPKLSSSLDSNILLAFHSHKDQVIDILRSSLSIFKAINCKNEFAEQNCHYSLNYGLFYLLIDLYITAAHSDQTEVIELGIHSMLVLRDVLVENPKFLMDFLKIDFDGKVSGDPNFLILTWNSMCASKSPAYRMVVVALLSSCLLSHSKYVLQVWADREPHSDSLPETLSVSVFNFIIFVKEKLYDDLQENHAILSDAIPLICALLEETSDLKTSSSQYFSNTSSWGLFSLDVLNTMTNVLSEVEKLHLVYFLCFIFQSSSATGDISSYAPNALCNIFKLINSSISSENDDLSGLSALLLSYLQVPDALTQDLFQPLSTLLNNETDMSSILTKIQNLSQTSSFLLALGSSDNLELSAMRCLASPIANSHFTYQHCFTVNMLDNIENELENVINVYLKIEDLMSYRESQPDKNEIIFTNGHENLDTSQIASVESTLRGKDEIIKEQEEMISILEDRKAALERSLDATDFNVDDLQTALDTVIDEKETALREKEDLERALEATKANEIEAQSHIASLLEELQSKMQENEEALNCIRDLEQKLSGLDEIVNGEAGLQQILDSTEKEKVKLTKDIQKLGIQNLDLQGNLNLLEEKDRRNQDEKLDFQKKIDELCQTIRDLEKQNNILLNQALGDDEKLNSLEIANNDLQRTLRAFSNEKESTVNENKALREQAAQFTEKNQITEEQAVIIGELEHRNKLLQGDISEQDARIRILEQENNELRNKLNEVTEAKGLIESANHGLKAKVDELTTRSEKASEQTTVITELETRNIFLEEELFQQKEQRLRFEEEKHAFNKKLETLEHANSVLREKIMELTESSRAAYEKPDDMEAFNVIHQKQLLMIKDVLQRIGSNFDFSGEVEDFEHFGTWVINTASEIRVEKSLLLNEKAKLIERLTESEDEIHRMKTELDDFKNALEMVMDEKDSLIAENMMLKNDTDDMKEQLSHLSASMDETIKEIETMASELKGERIRCEIFETENRALLEENNMLQEKMRTLNRDLKENRVETQSTRDLEELKTLVSNFRTGLRSRLFSCQYSDLVSKISDEDDTDSGSTQTRKYMKNTFDTVEKFEERLISKNDPKDSRKRESSNQDVPKSFHEIIKSFEPVLHEVRSLYIRLSDELKESNVQVAILQEFMMDVDDSTSEASSTNAKEPLVAEIQTENNRKALIAFDKHLESIYGLLKSTESAFLESGRSVQDEYGRLENERLHEQLEMLSSQVSMWENFVNNALNESNIVIADADFREKLVMASSLLQNLKSENEHLKVQIENALPREEAMEQERMRKDDSDRILLIMEEQERTYKNDVNQMKHAMEEQKRHYTADVDQMKQAMKEQERMFKMDMDQMQQVIEEQEHDMNQMKLVVEEQDRTISHLEAELENLQNNCDLTKDARDSEVEKTPMTLEEKKDDFNRNSDDDLQFSKNQLFQKLASALYYHNDRLKYIYNLKHTDQNTTSAPAKSISCYEVQVREAMDFDEAECISRLSELFDQICGEEEYFEQFVKFFQESTLDSKLKDDRLRSLETYCNNLKREIAQINATKYQNSESDDIILVNENLQRALADLSDTRKESELLHQEVHKLLCEKEELEEKIETLETSLQEANSIKVMLMGRLDDLENTVAENDSRYFALASELELTKAQTSELEANLESSSIQFSMKQKELEHTNLKLNRTKASLTEEQEAKTLLATKIIDLQTLYEASVDKSKDLEQQVTHLQTKVVEEKQHFEQMRKDLQEYIDRQTVEADKLKNEKNMMNEKVRSLEQSLDSAQKLCSSAEENVESLKRNLKEAQEGFRQNMDKVREELLLSQQRQQTLEKENQSNVESLDLLKRKLENMSRERNAIISTLDSMTHDFEAFVQEVETSKIMSDSRMKQSIGHLQSKIDELFHEKHIMENERQAMMNTVASHEKEVRNLTQQLKLSQESLRTSELRVMHYTNELDESRKQTNDLNKDFRHVKDQMSELEKAKQALEIKLEDAELRLRDSKDTLGEANDRIKKLKADSVEKAQQLAKLESRINTFNLQEAKLLHLQESLAHRIEREKDLNERCRNSNENVANLMVENRMLKMKAEKFEKERNNLRNEVSRMKADIEASVRKQRDLNNIIKETVEVKDDASIKILELESELERFKRTYAL